MIKAVIFDFGNVICRFSPETFVSKLAEYTHKDKECFQKLFKKPTELINRYETGLCDSEGFYQDILRHAQVDIPKDVFLEAFINIFSPVESIWGLARKLHKTYALALLSNTNKWHYEYCIKTVGIFDLFSAVSLSFVVGKMKPDPDIYQDSLAKLDMKPEECVFIDDLAINVRAACELGIHGIRYVSHQGLEERLVELGVVY